MESRFAKPATLGAVFTKKKFPSIRSKLTRKSLTGKRSNFTTLLFSGIWNGLREFCKTCTICLSIFRNTSPILRSKGWKTNLMKSLVCRMLLMRKNSKYTLSAMASMSIKLWLFSPKFRRIKPTLFQNLCWLQISKLPTCLSCKTNNPQPSILCKSPLTKQLA